MSEVEVKPCPFCGAQAVVDSTVKNWIIVTHKRTCYFVRWLDLPDIILDMNDSITIKRWNTRCGGGK